MISDESIARRYHLAWIRQTDYFSRVKPLLESGRWQINAEGKISRTSQPLEVDIPWVYVRSCPHRQCVKYHRVLFNCFNIIPEFCFDCYKVVVRPRTLVELFKLLETLRELPEDIAAKCGIEVREYVPALYGGYVYALGIDEGRNRRRLVSEAVAESVSPDVPVSLKRGCTEFEIGYGDSDRWEYSPGWRLFEQWVDENFVFPTRTGKKPEFIRKNTIRGWFEYAHSVGDMSYLLLSGGEPLHARSVTYHERGEEA